MFASYLIRLRCSERLRPGFLAHFLESEMYWRQVRQLSYGTAQPGANASVLSKLAVLLPSVEKQDAIARILDAADAAIDRTREAIAKARRVRDGLTQALLAVGIDNNGEMRSRTSTSGRFKQSELGTIPRDWKVLPLKNVAEVDRGKFTPRPRNDPRYYGGALPFVQTGDITNNRGRVIRQFSQTLNELGASVSRCFPAGTIAVTIAANIADTAILGIPMYFPDSLVGVVVNEPHNNRYIELCLRRAKAKLEAEAPQAAQKNINLDDLRPLLITVPPPEEQTRIAALYDAADRGMQANELILDKLVLLKRGLMQDLLTGRVRVNQKNR